MSNYKIIACDLDGTLLNSNGLISEENKNAIEKLTSFGVEFVPATGRTISEIPKELIKNPHIRYYIYANGAGVYDKLTNERILLCMPKEVSQKMLDILCSYDTHITFRHGGECFVDAKKQTEESFLYYHIWECHRRVIENYANLTENFIECAYSLDDIEVFAVFFHDEKEQTECLKLLNEIDEILLMDSYPNGRGVEICGINSGKGKALKALADKLELDISQTVACGDSDNDQTMIDTAGLSLAPSNSRQSIKDSADAVICSNDEHIVKYILENHIK